MNPRIGGFASRNSHAFTFTFTLNRHPDKTQPHVRSFGTLKYFRVFGSVKYTSFISPRGAGRRAKRDSSTPDL